LSQPGGLTGRQVGRGGAQSCVRAADGRPRPRAASTRRRQKRTSDGARLCFAFSRDKRRCRRPNADVSDLYDIGYTLYIILLSMFMTVFIDMLSFWNVSD